MLRSSIASAEWRETARGRTAGYGTLWTQKLSCWPPILLHRVQKISTLPPYSSLPKSPPLTRLLPGWPVLPSLIRPIKEKVLRWTPVTSGITYLYVFLHQQAPPVLLYIKRVFYCSRPSLVALEVDSDEDSAEPKSLLSPLSSDVDKSEDRMETVRPSPDLPCTRSQSASACEPTAKVKKNISASHKLFSNHLFYHKKSYVPVLNSCCRLCRNWATRGSDCVRIPTLPPKSVCVRLVSPGTTTLQRSAAVSNTETFCHFLT